MRAKFRVTEVTTVPGGNGETVGVTVTLDAVTSKPFDENGNSEDNSFSRWTPSGSLTMTVTNPDLFGKFKQGDKYYLDFSLAED